MLGGIRELFPRRILAVLVVVPVLFLSTGVAVALSLPHAGAVPTAATKAPPDSRPSSFSIRSLDPRSLKLLPHHVRASAGVAEFRQHPPGGIELAHLSVTAIPGVALKAYEFAAGLLARHDPACHLSWADLAGIARVESDNGLTWGSAARVSRLGTLTPPILGPLLDGEGGMPAYPTPDHGRLEHGGKWERAVGPMQFLPSTWAEYAEAVPGHGPANPENYWDAALAAGVYLCANGGNLATASGFDRAVLAYNHSRSYLALVRAWSRFYGRLGVAAVTAPNGLLPVGVSDVPPGSSQPSPEAVLDKALVRARQAGSFEVTFSLVVASRRTTIAGTAFVDTHTGAAATTVMLDGAALHLRQVITRGHAASYLELQGGLARTLGEKSGSWVAMTSRLEEALPVEVRAVVSFSEAVPLAPCVVAGVSKAARDGNARLDGVKLRSFSATAGVNKAERRFPSAWRDLHLLDVLAGAARFQASAWIEQSGVVRRVTLELPRLRGLSAAQVTLELALSGFGSDVHVTAPMEVAIFPPTSGASTTTSTTSTSTSTTSTSTTTTSSSSSTSTTSSTSSTSTTTTTLPPSTTTTTSGSAG